MGTISTIITQTVTLGSYPYTNPLTITSSGTILPTAYGATGLYAPSTVADASIANQGHIVGGAGVSMFVPAQNSGIGVEFASGGVFTNAGTVAGGNGSSLKYGFGQLGGTGVDIVSGGTLMNGGIIAGGTGGTGRGFYEVEKRYWPGIGGTGGTGVNLASGGTLINTGVIDGGSGGNGFPAAGDTTNFSRGGVGGVGVFLNGGTLVNSGTIAGGQTGTQIHPGPGPGDAVQFGTVAATLVVDPGAVFNGQVVANTSAADVLELAAGTSQGHLSGLGSQFLNFHTIDVDTSSSWTLDSASDVNGTVTIALEGSSTVDATSGLSSPNISFLSGGNETLMLGEPASFTGTISGFSASDTIDLLGLAGSSINYNASTGVLDVIRADGTTGAALHFIGNLSGFVSQSGGTDLLIRSL